MDYEKIAIQWIDKMMEMRINKKENKITNSIRGKEFVLFYIYQKNDVVEPGELSKCLSLSTARIAKILSQLEHEDLLTRSLNLEDRRKINVSLTSKGKNVAKINKDDLVLQITEVLKHLGSDDAKEYLRITNKLLEIYCKLN